jgi:tetratricopeptide (TPR) repeat protein
MEAKRATDWLAVGDRHRRSGDDASAVTAYQQAIQLARSAFDPAVEARALLSTGEILVLADDFRGARDAFDEAIGRAMEGGDRLIEAEAWFALASSCFDQALSKDGHDALLEAMTLYRQLADEAPEDLEAKRRLARSIRLYGEHLGVLGSESDAKQALELARIMYSDVGDHVAAEGIAEEMTALREYSR